MDPRRGAHKSGAPIIKLGPEEFEQLEQTGSVVVGGTIEPVPVDEDDYEVGTSVAEKVRSEQEIAGHYAQRARDSEGYEREFYKRQASRALVVAARLRAPARARSTVGSRRSRATCRPRRAARSGSRGDPPGLDDEPPSARARAVIEWVGDQHPGTVTYDSLIDHLLAADWYPEDAYSAVGEAERLGYIRVRYPLL